MPCILWFVLDSDDLEFMIIKMDKKWQFEANSIEVCELGFNSLLLQHVNSEASQEFP